MKTILTALITGALLVASWDTAEAQTQSFVVATDGNDANPGTKDRPFATLERARQALRDAPKDSPRNVIVGSGMYALARPFELGAADSGSEAHPVVWQAAPGGAARLSGGVSLPATAFAPVTDEKVLARLDPAARGQVLQADLSEIGVTELGSYPDLFRARRRCPNCSSTTSA